MDNSDERRRSRKTPEVSGDVQLTPATHTCEKPEERPKKPPSTLSTNHAGEGFAACERGLTPDLKRLSRPSLFTSDSAESGDGFIKVTKHNRSKHTPPSRVTIDVSPYILRCAGDAPIDLSEKQLLANYTRDKNKKLVDTKMKVFHGLEPNLKGADFLHGFDKAEKPKQRRSQNPNFSNWWFVDYLHSHKELLSTYKPQFVCPVSTLRLLICACYEEDETREWNVYARQLDGIWHLSDGWFDYHRGVSYKVQYAARMFEILSTETKTLEQAAVWAKNFGRHDVTYQVWLAQLGKHCLLYSGDVDCIDDNGNAVELKALSQSRWPSKDVARRTWAQVHLMGSKKVVIGYMDYSIGAATLIDTAEIDAESLTPDDSATWQTTICTACLDKILNSLKDDVFFQDEGKTYLLTLDRRTRKITAKISKDELPL